MRSGATGTRRVTAPAWLSPNVPCFCPPTPASPHSAAICGLILRKADSCRLCVLGTEFHSSSHESRGHRECSSPGWAPEGQPHP